MNIVTKLLTLTIFYCFDVQCSFAFSFKSNKSGERCRNNISNCHQGKCVFSSVKKGFIVNSNVHSTYCIQVQESKPFLLIILPLLCKRG